MSDNKESVLVEAERLTNDKRAEEYGTFFNNAEAATSIYFWIKKTFEVKNSADVALFLACLKLAREGAKHKRDNITDACGYLKLYYQEKQDVK